MAIGVWEVCFQTSSGSCGRGGHEGGKEKEGTGSEGRRRREVAPHTLTLGSLTSRLASPVSAGSSVHYSRSLSPLVWPRFQLLPLVSTPTSGVHRLLMFLCLTSCHPEEDLVFSHSHSHAFPSTCTTVSNKNPCQSSSDDNRMFCHLLLTQRRH